MTSSRDLNEDEYYARYPIQTVETIAKRLEELAARLRREANGFNKAILKPSAVLGNILSDYTQGVGGNGSYFYNLAHEAEILRAFRQGEFGDGPKGDAQ